MQSINSTYPSPIPRTNAPRHLACSTVNSYIDCLQEGNPLALAALVEGLIIVSSLIIGITCMVRRSACCSERHIHRPILSEMDLEQISENMEMADVINSRQDSLLSGSQGIELAIADPEIE